MHTRTFPTLPTILVSALALATACEDDAGDPTDAAVDAPRADAAAEAPPADAAVGADLTPDTAADAESTTDALTDLPATAIVAVPGLVAYWPLDERSGSAARDLTGKGNEGTLMFSPSWYLSGFPQARFVNSGALAFDGMDDFVQFQSQTLPAIDRPKTIALWVRYEFEPAPAPPRAIVVLLDRTTAAGVRIELRDGRLAATSYFYAEIVGVAAPASGWHHVAYSFDGTTHTLYVDGVAAASGTRPAEPGPVSIARLGRSSPSVPDAYRGLADDLRIYDRSLTRSEVAALAQGEW
jgi:hypothetical protein